VTSFERRVDEVGKLVGDIADYLLGTVVADGAAGSVRRRCVVHHRPDVNRGAPASSCSTALRAS
jgi:hypothetical protein